MEEFTAEQINSAANRVREMNRRSAFLNAPKNESFAPEKPPESNIKPNFSAPKENPFSRILKIADLQNFAFDEESKLILGIILLLSISGADELLILALVYIML